MRGKPKGVADQRKLSEGFPAEQRMSVMSTGGGWIGAAGRVADGRGGGWCGVVSTGGGRTGAAGDNG